MTIMVSSCTKHCEATLGSVVFSLGHPDIGKMPSSWKECRSLDVNVDALVSKFVDATKIVRAADCEDG